MIFTKVLKRLLAARRAPGGGMRRYSRLPRLDELEFSVIPATDESLFFQDVRPALLAQLLATRKSR